MIGRFFYHIVSGILGLFLSIKYIQGIDYEGTLLTFLIAGFLLGIINFFIKPILKIITLPIRVITFGLFSLIINIGLVFSIVGFLFAREFSISGIKPLIFTTLIIWLFNFLFGIHKSKI